MKAREASVVEREARRKSRNGALPVAGGAGSFAMAARAEVSRASGSDAVLAHEVAVVDKVVVRRRSLRCKIDVTTITVAQRPLVLVLVAAEAATHLGEHGLGPAFGDLDVAADAVPLCRKDMLRVLELQIPARELDRVAHVPFAVTAHAGAFVVRLRMAPDAVRLGGEMGKTLVARTLHAGMTLDAVDALEDVRAMLEGMRLRSRLEAKDAGARTQRKRQHHEHRQPASHRISSTRERRRSASVS
jgi:hypothetical protein